jgi:hypothetical protein
VFFCIIAGSAWIERRTRHMGRVRRIAVAPSRITSRHSLGTTVAPTQWKAPSPLPRSASRLAPRRRPPPWRSGGDERAAAPFMHIRVDMIPSTVAHRMRP